MIKGNKKKYRWFQIFLATISILGCVTVYLATYKLGAGLGEDSAKYLSTAENFAAGRGLIDYSGDPLTQWPPLYPVLLAGISLATGLDVFLIGWVLNILIFGATIWTGGQLFKRTFPHNLTLAVFGTLILATSTALVAVSANISSDPLFILLIVSFLLAAEEYLRTNSKSALTSMVVLAMLACLQRYAGISLVLTGAAVLFYSKKQTLIRSAAFAIGFMVLSSFPLLSWSFFHNYRLRGEFFGAHYPAVPVGNLILTIEKIFGWFLPTTILTWIHPALILIGIFALLILTNNRKDWVAWASDLRSSALLPSATFFMIYFGMLVLSTTYLESLPTGIDRIHVAILPALALVGLSTAKALRPKLWLKVPRKLRVALLWLGIVSFLIFPSYRLQKYVRITSEHGDNIYNFVNTSELRSSKLPEFLQSIPSEERQTAYTNNQAVAWFYLRQHITSLPSLDHEGEWPAIGENGIVVWFYAPLDYKRDKLDPESAYRSGWLGLLFSSKQGDVYELIRETP